MKRILCMMLAFAMVFALAACNNNEPAADPDAENNVEAGAPDGNVGETDGTPDEALPAPGTDDKTEEADGSDAPAKDDGAKGDDVKKEETKPADKPESKPAQPQTPAQKPAEPAKPATPPASSTPTTPSAPANPPANDPPAPEAPSAGDASGTVGDTLAAVWRANSSKSAEEIANAVISHSSIQFSGGVVPVEEGFLTGFDNAEIKGFKSGYMFAPAIGTIPFVGYVFELADETDADAFVTTLKSSANPRWNICTEAEQTIVEKSGGKVFFLMCPKSFEE